MSLPLSIQSGKRVGEIVGGVAYLPVSSKNYLAIGGGYSIDEQVLRTIENAGATLIDFWHKQTGRHHRVRVETFKANAKVFEFGYGRKLAAPMDCYEPRPGAVV